MLAIPATAQLSSLCTLHLVVSDRPDVPQRVMATCCRRQGAVVALAFERGGPDGTAALELAVEVEPRLRRGLIDRIAGLVDVLEVHARRPDMTGDGCRTPALA
jgi:acetolactate synthase regulatory subunit